MINQSNPSTTPLGGKVENGEVKVLPITKMSGINFIPSCVPPVQLDLKNPTVLKPVSDAEILSAPIEIVIPHPVIQVTYKPKNLRYLVLTLQLVGQLEAIDVVKHDNKYLIVDGLSRYIAAQHLGFKSIWVRVLDLDESEVKALRAHKNVKTKRPFSEQIELVHLMLESLGSSQGKKRNLEEVIKICDAVESENFLTDRFEIVRSVLDLEMSAGTLRKAVKIYQFETGGNRKQENLKLLEKVENGEISIDAAYNLVKSFIKADEERKLPNLIEEANNYPIGKNWYRLFNKSCEDLCDLNDESIQTVIFSPPYWKQRIYPVGICQSELRLGEEETPDQYVENSIRIYRNLKRVLKHDGNLFINIAESYSDGACASVVSKLIVAMEKDGWYLIQNIIWKKSNPKPVGGKINRLRPSTEAILHFSLQRENRFYRPFRIWDSNGQLTLQGGCNDEIEGDKKQKKKKFSLDKPVISFTDFLDEQVVAGVITGSVVNKSQLKKIDSDFNHIAPSPEYISAIPILTTTRPGDIVLDIFCGTSSLLALPLRLKRNVIGYDTDPESIRFSTKYLQSIIGDQFTETEVDRLENDFLEAA